MKGYIIIPKTDEGNYLGVDRNPFVPMLIESEMINSDDFPEVGNIWSFYPTGWRQSAYKLYEENAIDVNDEFSFLKDLNIAKQIVEIINSNIEKHGIYYCEIFELKKISYDKENPNNNFLGYDLAYLGGDFYSAINNGLFINPVPELIKKYKNQLNQNGLFTRVDELQNYILDFKRNVLSEAESNFYVYKLYLAASPTQNTDEKNK